MRQILLICSLALAAQAADPSWYRSQASWLESFIASRAALDAQSAGPPARALPDFGRQDFTVSAWVKTRLGGTIVATAPAEGVWVQQGKSFFVRDGKLGYDIGWVGTLGGRTVVADDRWHHVAVTGPRDLTFYVDGQADGGGSLAGQPDDASWVTKIGYTSTNFPAQSGFDGLLDDVVIWDRRLSATELADLAKHDGAVGWWPFDGNLVDRAGGNHGAVSGVQPAFAAGHAGQAVRLDGKTAVVLSASPAVGFRAQVWPLLRRDFTRPEAVRQMDWVQRDKLLAADFDPADPRALAARFVAAIADARLATEAKVKPADLAAAADLYYRDRRLTEQRARTADLDPAALRRAITALGKDYAPGYPAADLLARLARAEADLDGANRAVADGAADAEARAVAAAQSLRGLAREALVGRSPLFGDFDRVLFIRRRTYASSHYYTDYIDGCREYGGNLCTVSLRDGSVRELLPQMSGGIYGRFDLSFDAKRVVFDYKAGPGQGFRIWECAVDGSGLRQLTRPPSNEADLALRFRGVGTPTGLPYDTGSDDMHPCYLPCGDIVFVSTRCRKGILCDGPDVLTSTVLYRMGPDGQNPVPLSFNTVSEAAPSITNDGRILYTRWEYVDKGGSACKCLWAMRPDGSGSVDVYGSHITHPTTFLDGREVPGRPGLTFAVGAPHMPLGVGSILRIDPAGSRRELATMTNLTPDIDTPDEFGYRHRRDGQWVGDMQGPLFCQPYPLSADFALCAGNLDQPAQAPDGYALMLLDTYGNRLRLHAEAGSSCWMPTPLRPRVRPPVLADLPSWKTASVEAQYQPGWSRGSGTLYLQDCYQGMTGIARGRVKWLRICEDVPRPWEARRYWPGDDRKQQHDVVGRDGHLAPRIVWGIVPVQPDGSAYFEVPADKNIFFQALDENYMELQRMRSFVNVRPGEQRGCVGCHEERQWAPQGGRGPSLAVAGAPARPTATPGEVVPRTVHYTTDVQPVWDKHCVTCHDGTKKQGDLDLSGELTEQFNRSYEQIIDKHLAGNVVDEIGAKHGNIEATPPLTYGSPTSRLAKVLRGDHHGVKLSAAEWMHVVTWIDANAPYYGSWDGRRNLRYRDLAGFRPTPKAGEECAAWDGNRSLVPALTGPAAPARRYLCADNGRGRVYLMAADGTVEWEYPAEVPQDVWMLPSGNVLFSHLRGVREVNRAKEIVWEYKAAPGTEVHTCQPLGDGRVLLAEGGTSRLLEVNRAGAVEREVKVAVASTGAHTQFRIVRKLPGGNYLAALVGDRRIREYGPDGATVRDIPVPGDPFCAVRLRDGNTLIGTGDGHQVLEVDARDKVVWSITENELPGHPLRFVAGLERLANGNTVICNWGGHGHVGEQPQLLEVTRDKRVVWQVADFGRLRTVSNVFVLDEPGEVLR
ncbi:MAG: hypothetical protein HZB16_10990 [Armatimonadetes bacterium]|nr:hypothetical protein [Armatimonadota bacterium]